MKQDYEQAKRAEYQASHMVAFAKMAAEAGFAVKMVSEDEYAEKDLGSYSLDVEVTTTYTVNGATRKFESTVWPATREGWYSCRFLGRDNQFKDPEKLVAKLQAQVARRQKREEAAIVKEARDEKFKALILGTIKLSGQTVNETDATFWDYRVGNMLLTLDADADVVTVQMNLKPEEFAKLMALGLTVEK